MVPVTVKYDDDSLAELDRFIAQGAAGNRTDALRDALRSWLKSQRDAELAEQYRRGYAQFPEHEDPDLIVWATRHDDGSLDRELGGPWEFDE